MKRILIIGATSAIAIACARRWAAQGSQFFLVARHAERLAQTAADLKMRGATQVEVFEMDATDTPKHALMLEAALSYLHQIDLALVAHGSLFDQKLCEQDLSLTLQTFADNATSTIALLTVLGNQFERQQCGALAVISSVAGDRGRPSNYVYGSAKAAVSSFCEGLRARLFKFGVLVMTVKPGFVDTPMTQGLPLPTFLVATPERVADDILRGLSHKKAVLYTPGFWQWIMLIVRHIPQFIFQRLHL